MPLSDLVPLQVEILARSQRPTGTGARESTRTSITEVSTKPVKLRGPKHVPRLQPEWWRKQRAGEPEPRLSRMAECMVNPQHRECEGLEGDLREDLDEEVGAAKDGSPRGAVRTWARVLEGGCAAVSVVRAAK